MLQEDFGFDKATIMNDPLESLYKFN